MLSIQNTINSKITEATTFIETCHDVLGQVIPKKTLKPQ